MILSHLLPFQTCPDHPRPDPIRGVGDPIPKRDKKTSMMMVMMTMVMMMGDDYDDGDDEMMAMTRGKCHYNTIFKGY